MQTNKTRLMKEMQVKKTVGVFGLAKVQYNEWWSELILMLMWLVNQVLYPRTKPSFLCYSSVLDH